MKYVIRDAKIDWRKQYQNNPIFTVLLNTLPHLNDFRFVCKNSMYVANKDGIYTYFYYTQPGDGFGGNIFLITMQDTNEQILLRGPWSSRASRVNQLGLGPCGEILHSASKVDFENNNFYWGLAVSEELLKLCAELCGCYVVKTFYKMDMRNHFPDPSKFYHDNKHSFGSKSFNNILNQVYCHIDTPIPDGVEYGYCPSLHPKHLVKGHN